MGLISDLGLGTARALRGRLGARGALRVLTPMIAGSDPSAARAGAIVVALECAAEVRDAAALETLATWWSVEHAGARAADLAPVLEVLLGTMPGAARLLAEAEVERRDRPHGRATRAVVRERLGALDEAAEDWRAALAMAERQRDAAAARAARIQLARVLSRRTGHKHEAARVAASLEGAPATDREALVRAIARLAEPGRYARVQGLDALVELAKRPEPALARAAIRAACAHADESGGALTAVELERVRSAARCWPVAAERERALVALDALEAVAEPDAAARSAALVRAAGALEGTRAQLERARALLSGGPGAALASVGPRPAREAGRWLALAAIAALRAGAADDEVRARIRELRGAGVGEGEAPAWTATWCVLARPALRSDPRALADVLALAEALLATRGAPPRGFLHFAAHLERAGAERLALRAHARAHEQREPGAKERRVDALIRAGWRASSEGRADDALEALREARALTS